MPSTTKSGEGDPPPSEMPEIGVRNTMLTPEPGAPLGRLMATPAILPVIMPAADDVGGTGRSSLVSLSTAIVDLATDVSSIEPDTVTWSRRNAAVRSAKLTVTTLSAISRTFSTRMAPKPRRLASIENKPGGALTIENRPSGPVVAVIGVPTRKMLAPAIGCLLSAFVTTPVMRARRAVDATWPWVSRNGTRTAAMLLMTPSSAARRPLNARRVRGSITDWEGSKDQRANGSTVAFSDTLRQRFALGFLVAECQKGSRSAARWDS